MHRSPLCATLLTFFLAYESKAAASERELPAQERAPEATVADETPEGDGRLGLVIGGGVGITFGPMNEASAGWDAYAGYYALPWLVTGAALTQSDSSDNEGREYDGWLFAGRAAAHPFPEFFVDPWVAIDLGFASAEAGDPDEPPSRENRDTVFVGGGIGVDFVALQTVALGVHVRKRFGFANDVGTDVGLHAEVRF